MREPRLALQFGVGAQGGWQSCTLSQGPLDRVGWPARRAWHGAFMGSLLPSGSGRSSTEAGAVKISRTGNAPMTQNTKPRAWRCTFRKTV